MTPARSRHFTIIYAAGDWSRAVQVDHLAFGPMLWSNPAFCYAKIAEAKRRTNLGDELAVAIVDGYLPAGLVDRVLPAIRPRAEAGEFYVLREREEESS